MNTIRHLQYVYFAIGILATATAFGHDAHEHSGQQKPIDCSAINSDSHSGASSDPVARAIQKQCMKAKHLDHQNSGTAEPIPNHQGASAPGSHH